MPFQSKDPNAHFITINCQLHGTAKDAVMEKIHEMRTLGFKVFGKERAVNVLLAEYYRAKKAGKI
jgi:hypothetical protein